MSNPLASSSRAPAGLARPSPSRARAQHLPPSPLPIQPSSVASTSSSSKLNPTWPLGFSLYFDPLSDKALKLSQQLQTQTQPEPLVTTTLSEATHLIVDPDSGFGEAVARAGQTSRSKQQHLVSLEWLSQSMDSEVWRPEEDFLICSMEKSRRRSKGKGREVRVEAEADLVERVEEQEVESSLTSHSLKEVTLPSTGPWSRQEDENLAHFIASLPTDGADSAAENEYDWEAFQEYAKTAFTNRSAEVCWKHCRKVKKSIEARAKELRAQDDFEAMSMSRRRRGRERGSVANARKSPAPARHRQLGPWLDAEKESLARFLALQPAGYLERDENSQNAFRRYADLVSTERSAAACQQHYTIYRSFFDYRIEEIKNPSSSDTRATGSDWIHEEDKALALLLSAANRYPSIQTAAEAFHQTHPNRSVVAIKSRYWKHMDTFSDLVAAIHATRSNPLALPTARSSAASSSSSSSSASTDRRSSHQHPSSSTLPPSKRARTEAATPPSPSKSNAVASGSQPRLPPRSTHPTRSTRVSTPPPALAPAPPFPSPSRPSPPPQPLEPPSFLTIGSKPSHLSSSASALYCFFCGNSDSPTFTTLALATQSLQNPEEVVSVPGRLACTECKEVYDARSVEGGTGGEKGELVKLAWVTEEVVKRGLEVRRVRVEGS